MLSRTIDAALDNRWLVLILLAIFSVFGPFTLFSIPIEAFPDLTNNQVTVITEAPGLPPSEVEQLVTFPIESALMGLPRTVELRSISKLSLSLITLVFEDDVDIYFARQVVNERVREAKARLPQGLEPTLGPLATPFGEVLQYTIEGERYSLMDRKTFHDWVIRYALRTVPGVNEVNSWGGYSQQYAIIADPVLLRKYGITLRELYDRVAENNENFGGGYIEHAAEQYTVLGLGRAQVAADLERVVLREQAGVPVLLRDVARVEAQPMLRQGAASRDASGETVSGTAIILKGVNGREAITRIKNKLQQIRMPEGMRVSTFYDQSSVIDHTIATVRRNLLEAALLVLAVLLVFLGNIPAALIVAMTIPVSMLFGFVGMSVFGVSANLMSLGAIDFGMIVDGAVVMVENAARRLHEGNTRCSVKEVVRDAAKEVARPIVFAVGIIIAVYIPLFFLEGLERRMFRPMAITVVSALIGSLILSLTVIPVLSSFALKNKPHQDPRWWLAIRNAYEALLAWVLRHQRLSFALSLASLAVALASLGFIGTDFIPRLDEGSIVINTRKLPGVSVTTSANMQAEVERILKTIPEVTEVVSKVGRPDVATEAMPVGEADVYVQLKERELWRSGLTRESLVEEMAHKLEAVPGIGFNMTQPMAMRLDEAISGIKSDVALKIFGEDTGTLEQLANRAARIISGVRGAADVQAEILTGVPELRVEANRAQLARYGLNVRDLRETVEAASGGLPVSEMIEGQRRFPIVIRFPDDYRAQLDRMGTIMLRGQGGEQVPLSQLASIRVARGPEVVNREDAQRRIVVQANVRGRDMGTFVAEAQQRISAGLNLPAGYLTTWGGQFENQQRAMARLAILLPASIALIFALLYTTFHSFRLGLLILAAVPFSLIGGIAALWLRGITLNLPACIGFIALFGVAVLNGIVMVSQFEQLRHQGHSLAHAVREGALLRLRPVLMTALVASLGFLPMATSTSQGAEVQRPLATVVIGGLVTATALTLFLLPAMYLWVARKTEPPQALV